MSRAADRIAKTGPIRFWALALNYPQVDTRFLRLCLRLEKHTIAFPNIVISRAIWTVINATVAIADDLYIRYRLNFGHCLILTFRYSHGGTAKHLPTGRAASTWRFPLPVSRLSRILCAQLSGIVAIEPGQPFITCM
jgi:hypothetical protein